MRSCPSDQALRMLAEDELGSVVFAAIEEHVEVCPACRGRLESLAWKCAAPVTPGPRLLPEAGEPPMIPGFSVERELGRGATSVVYLALDQKLGRRVALKVMRRADDADPCSRKRWSEEARAFARVRHPGVVALYQAVDNGAWLYLVLEYVPGGTLRDHLMDSIGPRDAAQLVSKTADAVYHIHQAGILHLDLKPSNILLEAEPGSSIDQPTPKVADFGISRFFANREINATGITYEGDGFGTPSYMAPEQLPGASTKLSPATDVHGLGAILYHLVTGFPPYQGETPLDAMQALRTLEPARPRLFNPKLSRDLEAIILKCLQKDPGRRYVTAQSLADDLRRWLDGRPAQARRVSLLGRGWRWCRRRPVAASLAAGILVCFLAVFEFYRRADTQRQRAHAAQPTADRSLDVASSVIGGFEIPQLTGGREFITIAPGSEPAGFGWSVTSGNVNVVVGEGGFITAFAGTQWLDLDGGTAGTIQQSFATTPGGVYSLSFAYANNPILGTVPASATVRLFNTENNAQLLPPFTITHSTSSGSDPDWIQSPVIQFTAVGALTTLSFASDDPAGSIGGIALDGISVSRVPEP